VRFRTRVGHRTTRRLPGNYYQLSLDFGLVNSVPDCFAHPQVCAINLTYLIFFLSYRSSSNSLISTFEFYMNFFLRGNIYGWVLSCRSMCRIFEHYRVTDFTFYDDSSIIGILFLLFVTILWYFIDLFLRIGARKLSQFDLAN
jgi:hypothetical protein